MFQRLIVDVRAVPNLIADRHVLSPAEVGRAAEFGNDGDRNRYVAGRVLLRSVVGTTLDRSPAEVPVVVIDGRPAIDTERPPQVSLSHSGDVVACVCGPFPVGIDVERVLDAEPEPTLVRRTCSVRERSQLARVADPAAEFTRFWTRKEALTKAAGVGLGVTLSLVDASRDRPGVPWPGRYRVHDLDDLPDGYLGAVAAQGVGWRVTRR